MADANLEAYHFQYLHRDTIAGLFQDNRMIADHFGDHMRITLPKRSIEELRKASRKPSGIWRGTAISFTTSFPPPCSCSSATTSPSRRKPVAARGRGGGDRFHHPGAAAAPGGRTCPFQGARALGQERRHFLGRAAGGLSPDGFDAVHHGVRRQSGTRTSAAPSIARCCSRMRWSGIWRRWLA